MNPFTLTLTAALAAPIVIAAPLPQPAELLATNTVVAVYEKTFDRPCMHRTALCPDRCDHAKKLAIFRVVSNENYERTGQYGDPKSEPGSTIYVDMQRDEPGQSENVRKMIAELQPGDAVRLKIDHYYIKGETNQYPVRPVTLIERVAKPAGIKLTPAQDKAQTPIAVPFAR